MADKSICVRLSKLVILSVCFAMSSVAAAAPPKYKLVRLGRVGFDMSDGHAINRRGHVMGSLFKSSTEHTFLYKDGVMTDIAPFLVQVNSFAFNNKDEIVGNSSDGPYIFQEDGQFKSLSTATFIATTAFDINDYSQVTGFGRQVGQTGPSQAYIYTNGVATFVPTGPFIQLTPIALNNRGDLVGLGTLPTNAERAFMYSEGSTISLGSLEGGGRSVARAVNGSGEVTGNATIADSSERAFIYSNGTMKNLGTLGGNGSIGFDINSSGQVVGISNTANGFVHAFVYKNGVMVDLGAPGGDFSEARSITNNGIVVGLVTRLDNSTTAFIYGVDGNLTHDVNDLIDANDPLKPHVRLSEPGFYRPVNELGQFVATGIDMRTGQRHSYVASPIDFTKPIVKAIIAGTKGTSGWYTSNVSIKWSVTDAQAPIADTTGCKPSTVATDTVGQDFKCRAVSMGGVTLKAVTIKRDTSRPSVTINTPANGVVFNRNQVVTANFSCADAASGIAACTGTIANGERINTSSKVTNATFRVVARDRAGISRTVTTTYSVK